MKKNKIIIEDKPTKKDYILFAGVVLAGLLVFAFLMIGIVYSMDRSLALKDFQKGKKAENCIFQSNCDYYNEKL